VGKKRQCFEINDIERKNINKNVEKKEYIMEYLIKEQEITNSQKDN
jgi:hypothetical protein